MMKTMPSVVLCMLLTLSAWAEANPVPPYDPSWKPTRDLTRFVAKLRAGEPVTVAAIGGSVTVSPSWAVAVTEWLQAQFPENEITFRNFAEGGTPPSQTIWKFRRGVVPASPDLMFIEYAVNAYRSPEENYKPLDGMVQQLLRMPDPADVVFVYVGSKQWKPSEGWESVNVQPVGRHYGFPEVHARAHLQTKLDAGEAEWDVLFRDGIHPRWKGYNDPSQSANAIYAEAVIELLKAQMAQEGDPTPLPPVPEPFYSGAWVTADVIPATEVEREGSWAVKPAQGTGSFYFSEFLESNEKDASLTLTARTTCFVIFTYAAFDGGTIAWSVDGGPVRTRWLGQGKEENFLTRVWSPIAADDLPLGEHTLKVWVAPQMAGRDDTKGNWIRIGAFGVAAPEAGEDHGGERPALQETSSVTVTD